MIKEKMLLFRVSFRRVMRTAVNKFIYSFYTDYRPIIPINSDEFNLCSAAGFKISDIEFTYIEGNGKVACVVFSDKQWKLPFMRFKYKRLHKVWNFKGCQ